MLIHYNDFLEARRGSYKLRNWHDELGYPEFRENAERERSKSLGIRMEL